LDRSKKKKGSADNRGDCRIQDGAFGGWKGKCRRYLTYNKLEGRTRKEKGGRREEEGGHTSMICK
jgi:hypothetical protein